VIKSQTKIKVRYAETDQMGYVHHSYYALYLEEARMDLLKVMGIDCAQLEKDGIIMPVVEMRTRYSSPLRFGDSIVVEAEIAPPWDTKLEFRYKIYNQDQKLVSRSRTTLVFAEKESGKLVMNTQKYFENFITYNQP
jgi:acyl-CoA thioester hydrolase